MIIAILKILAPKAKIPPSPNRNACKISATVTAILAAYGPIKIASSVPPTACALVPPGTGTLNIIIRNDNEAAIPSIGASSRCSFNCTFTFFAETATTGAATANITAQVAGLK